VLLVIIASSFNKEQSTFYSIIQRTTYLAVG
jgi:hypothetical protein